MSRMASSLSEEINNPTLEDNEIEEKLPPPSRYDAPGCRFCFYVTCFFLFLVISLYFNVRIQSIYIIFFHCFGSLGVCPPL